ncbi:hypothetical protein ERO13_A06G028250v2 [Gossypium hirsutum]|nr:hypothetical protein ERO13_A06G028250v2 [Gossypium hirsutum]
MLYKVYDYCPKSYSSSGGAAIIRYCSNVFRHYNDYAIDFGERTIGKIGIVRKLREGLSNLFIDLFDCCINHACDVKFLYPPNKHGVVTRVFCEPLASEYRD